MKRKPELDMYFPRHKGTIELKTGMDELLEHLGISRKITEQRVVKYWANIVGEIISSETQLIFIQDKTLVVRVASSALKHTLQFKTNEIIGQVNSYIGFEIINHVRLL